MFSYESDDKGEITMALDVCAIIVARGGSLRLKNKNMLDIGGYSMLAHKIIQLKRCDKIDRIIVGSDSEEILKEACFYGAETVKRPDYYCNESQCTANEMIYNMCSLIETDVVVWAHCTNPLLSPETYDRAVSVFLANEPMYDSLLSVTVLKEHLWTSESKPLNYNPYARSHTLARDLTPIYMQDGGIFIQRHKNMLRNSYFFGAKPYLFIVPENEVMDINTPRDLLVARILLMKKTAT